MKLFNFTPKFNLNISNLFASKDKEEPTAKPFKFLSLKSLRRKKPLQVEDNVYFSSSVHEPITFNDPIVLKLGESVKSLNYRCVCDEDCGCSFKSILPSFDFCESSSSLTDSLYDSKLVPSPETLEIMSICSTSSKVSQPIKSVLKKSNRDDNRTWSISTNKSTQLDIIFPFEEPNSYNLTTELKRFTIDSNEQYKPENKFRNSSSTLGSTKTNETRKELRFNEQIIVYETFSRVDYPRIANIDPYLTPEEHMEIYDNLAHYKYFEMASHPESVNNLAI